MVTQIRETLNPFRREGSRQSRKVKNAIAEVAKQTSPINKEIRALQKQKFRIVENVGKKYGVSPRHINIIISGLHKSEV